MDIKIFLAVLFAAVLHASWNAVIRSNGDRFQGMLLLTVSQGLMGLVMAVFVPLPSGQIWLWVVASGALHSFYKMFLVAAYQQGDLSRVYPIARGTAPLFVVVVGFFWLPDSVQFKEYMGIGLIGIGVMLMAQGVFSSGESRRLIPFALGSALCTAAYSIVDGLGARIAMDATMFTAWMFVFDGLIFSTITLATRGRKVFIAPHKVWVLGVVAGALSLVTYWIVVWAMTVAPIALVAAVRETSVLFAVLIGVFVLREKISLGKAVAAAVILMGIIIIRL